MGLNGSFAATEFLLVAVRSSPSAVQLAARGNARARVVEALLGDLHRVVSGVQLGITLTSLAIGALGEATFAKIFQAIWPGGLGRAHGPICACERTSSRAFALLKARAARGHRGNRFPSTLRPGAGGAGGLTGFQAVPVVPEHLSLGDPFAGRDIERDCEGFGSDYRAGSSASRIPPKQLAESRFNKWRERG